MDTKTKTYFNLSIIFGFFTALCIVLTLINNFFALVTIFTYFLTTCFYTIYRRHRLRTDETYKQLIARKESERYKNSIQYSLSGQRKYITKILVENNFNVSKEVLIKNEVFDLISFFVDDVNKKFAYYNNSECNIYNYSDLLYFNVSNFEQIEKRTSFVGKLPASKSVNVYYAVITIQLKNNLHTPYITIKFESLNNGENIVPTQDIIGTLEYIQNYNNNN